MKYRTVYDQLGIKREIPEQVRRIISLVPSQTAYLAWLGCDKEVVGITKFCVNPDDWFRTKTRVGGTKNLKIDIIKNLNPDLIIGNKEENTQHDIEQLNEYPLWLSDVNTFGEALEMMASIGLIVDRKAKTDTLIRQLRQERDEYQTSIGTHRPRIAYLIWRKPYMLAGKNTFIDAMLEEAGYENIVTESRYPEFSIEQIADRQPDYIFLSSEPYPFQDKHKGEWLKYFSEKQVRLTLAEPFSWYGSHLLKAFTYFAELKKNLPR